MLEIRVRTMRGEDAVRFNMTSQSGFCPFLLRSSAFTSISSSSGGKEKDNQM
jgi:hypothetical protein